MRPSTRLLATALLVLALAAPAPAFVTRVRAGELRRAGVDLYTFQPITFSARGRLLVAHEKAPLEDKKKGVTYKLWVLRLASDGRLESIRALPLSIPSLEQAALTPDERGLVIITRAGATYLLVDLETGEVHTLMEHRPGQPGFRAHPTVLWSFQGQLYTTGYYYDEEDYAGKTHIARLDLSRRGVDAFIRGPEVESLERSIADLQFLNYNSPRLGFFGARRGDDIALYRWQGGELVEIDRAPTYPALWGAASRMVYSARRPGGFDLVVYDADLDRRWKLDHTETPYRYLFLSADGSTAVACQFELKRGRMDVYYAKDRDDFKLQPVEGMQGVGIGWLRVASDGRFLSLYNESGLTIAELP